MVVSFTVNILEQLSIYRSEENMLVVEMESFLTLGLHTTQTYSRRTIVKFPLCSKQPNFPFKASCNVMQKFTH